MKGEDSSDEGVLLDAEVVLDVTTRLHDLRDRVDGADVTASRRSRWERKLLDLTAAARRDLAAADEQLHRFEAELDRVLGP